MNADQREAVRSNAKYLREVRPIDPDEIHEYVEGGPHPAAVRQVLRESATDLGLLEREDGTFVPIEEGPVVPTFHGVEAFPGEYGRALEDLLVERYGPGWPEGETGDAIRERIRAVKTDYLYGNPVEYDDETALAYAVYHLPDYYAVAQYVLAELASDGLIPRHLRVLDVGAGVGGPALGLHDFLPEDALVDYHAVEPSAAADVLESLLGETGRNFHATVHRERAEAFDPVGRSPDADFDLILFSNVLSELDDPAVVVERYGDALAADGTVVATAPADRNTAIGLRDVERAVADDGPFTIYGPTVRLWPGAAPSDDCWSFDVQPDLAVPPFQRRLDEAAGEADADGDGGDTDTAQAGEFVNVDVQYAYSLLRLDGRRTYDFVLDEAQTAKLANSETHVTNRVDAVFAKLSHDLSEGRNPLYRVGDGSQTADHFAVLTEESMLNADLRTAGYGEVLSVENVLVLWNDDERAFNLVVDGETVVDRVPA
jgi:SAM-dependent methyltransferase